MRDSTSNGPVRSIWSISSNSSDPICKWVSSGIMFRVPSILVDRTNISAHVLAEMPKNPRFSPNRRSDAVRTIEMLAYPRVQLLDVCGPLQVFATANEQIVQGGGAPPYALRVVAKDVQSVTASSGLGIATSPLPRS